MKYTYHLTDRDHKVCLTLSRPEARAARKGLIEPIGGFGLDDYERQLGMPECEARAFKNRIRSFNKSFIDESEKREITLSIHELRVLRNGLKLTLNELGEDEYYYRSGQQYQVAEEALAEFERVLAEMEAELGS